ncbi:hypothetical protein J007_01496 [Cryptococcus neoformans]|nr:hypothetical protein J007_01496 [Cryptococcus neoformans var. grubii]OXC63240.1 hypothetical protein C358_01500 [Cryptococcus neoformans var. grubii MW-RSA852]
MSIHSISETYYSGPINSTLRGSSNDVRLFGTGKAAHSDGKDVDEENGDDADIDGEGLLWDAQTALIGNEPEIATSLYIQAALPPYCSPSACFALGNLLIRGSMYTESPSAPIPSFSELTTGRPGTSLWRKLFGAISTPQSPSPAHSSSPTRTGIDLVACGWQMPKVGKRAVRDAEKMDVAGAWFVLGLGWTVRVEMEHEKRLRKKAVIKPSKETFEDSEEEAIFTKRKIKGKGRLHSSTIYITPSQRADDPFPIGAGSPKTAHSESTKTEESSLVETPAMGDVESFENEDESEMESLSIMYDLLSPLLRLYRQGHIQSQDPVALPPISLQQLPPALRPKNEADKGRNVWWLGRVVAQQLIKLDILKTAKGEGQKEQLRKAVVVSVNYMIATTSPDLQAEIYFRSIASTSSIGLECADDLVTNAKKRLQIITNTPRDEKILRYSPFPSVLDKASPPNPQKTSASSPRSIFIPPKVMVQSAKSTVSLAALAGEEEVTSLVAPGPKELGAMETLKRVHEKAVVQDEEICREEVHDEPGVSYSEVRPTIRRASTSPHLQTHLHPPPSSSRTRRRLPFELPSSEPIAPIDPVLAAAEMSSALTKHVVCSVCGMKGVNFPECRKCGLRFCSRGCRVGEDRAGNGKRHICGLWKIRTMGGSAMR